MSVFHQMGKIRSTNSNSNNRLNQAFESNSSPGYDVPQMKPSKTPEPSPSTRDRILQTAERLFAEKGIDSVSLREITAAAGVNIAAVHYHFGSKKMVLEELFAQRSEPIAKRRLELLSQVRRDKKGKPVLEDVLHAFLQPALQARAEPGGASFVLLRARIAFENAQVRKAVLGKAFDASSREFLRILAQALPDLDQDEMYWRFHFVLGAMVYTMAAPGRIEAITDGAVDSTDSTAALSRLVAFAAAGFRA
jgi:AcrR family transcriptional regulator